MIDQQENIAFINATLNIYSHCIQGEKITSREVIADLIRCSDLRGMEHYAIKPIYLERARQRQKIRRSILQIQRRIKQEGFSLKDDSNGSLAMVAAALAAPAKAVARTMGQNDALSAKHSQRK